MSVIVCGSRTYEPTEDDVLWLKRAVAKEGRPQRWVAQTLVNLFAYLHSKSPKRWTSLEKLVRAYAQPVNPRWYPDGDLFKKWHARDPKAHPVRVARARRDVHSAKTRFPAVVEEAVCRALHTGPVDIPGECTDYAAPWIDATKKGMVPLTPAKRGTNRFWCRRGAGRWKGYSVA